jgi:lipopolysaccharide export system protein LptA
MKEFTFSSVSVSFGKIFLVLCLLMVAESAVGQKRVHLKQADKAKGGGKGENKFQRLLGDVIFTHNNSTIYCDSAHFYKKKNSVEAFGHVRIIDGDSITITGSRLEYEGDTRKAKLRRNVVFTKKGRATLYTDNLDFSRSDNLAYYFSGGKLVDSATTLTSDKGYYRTNSNLATFKKDVVVRNPDYTMYSDSLQYNSSSKIIYFVKETKVINKDSSTLTYASGQYNTATKSTIIKSGTAESEDYTIIGDKTDLDGIRNLAKIRGNVVMTSKKENLIIYGQASDYYKSTGVRKVYDRAFIAKIDENTADTLFISADTLVSIDSEDPKKKRLLAYHNVKIFRKDLQGKADSLAYHFADSTLFFYNEPILWSEGNQMTADSISMLIQNNTVSKIFLVMNSFVISQDTLKNYNQIKGKKMTAQFSKSKINKVIVQGNGESLYYALDDGNKNMLGMNKITCSHITIRFREGKVNNLSFYVKPDAQFIPPHELKEEDKNLKGFDWRAKLKPTRKDVVKEHKKLNEKSST